MIILRPNYGGNLYTKTYGYILHIVPEVQMLTQCGHRLFRVQPKIKGNTRVGHAAHLGGALVGIAWGLLRRPRQRFF